MHATLNEVRTSMGELLGVEPILTCPLSELTVQALASASPRSLSAGTHTLSLSASFDDYTGYVATPMLKVVGLNALQLSGWNVVPAAGVNWSMPLSTFMANGTANASNWWSSSTPEIAFDAQSELKSWWYGSWHTEMLSCTDFSAWVSFTFNEPTAVAGYAIESRTDQDDCCHEYDSPKDWKLLGSNDGGTTWQTLDAVSDESG